MITIPESIWQTMLIDLASNRRDVEQICYLDGVLLDSGCGKESVVTTLVFPDAQLSAGRFSVSAHAMSGAGKHLRRWNLRRLAQVHTHPGQSVEHSSWDDELAYSQVPGAISIVLPYYGKVDTTLREAGVHLRTPSEWRLLAPDAIANLIRIIPTRLDFRQHLALPNEKPSIIPTRKRPWWNLLAFWKH